MTAQAFASFALFLALLVASILGPVRLRRLRRRLGGRIGLGLSRVRALRPAPVQATSRPFEEVAADAHRLGRQFHCLPQGASFARFEARRQAYDAVLTEACRALGVDHLLGVLPAGPDLDRERERVELVLDLAGLRLDDAA
jgi:hypothetical protein